MPYNASAPDWRTRNHPLNDLLKTLGARGGMPTRAELAAIPGGPTIHQDIKDAARRIQHHKDRGENLAAQRIAESTLNSLGPRVEGELLPEPEPDPNPIDYDAMARRGISGYDY